MRKLKTLTMMALMGVFAFGQTSNNSPGGTIPFVASLDITYAGGNASALTGASLADYDQGFHDILNFIGANGALFDANDSCTVALKVGSWTLPADYPSDGNKNIVTSDSDLHMKINGIVSADEVAIQGGFGSLVELTSSDQVFIRALDDGGVQTADYGADARVDLAFSKDPIGAYAITVTQTVAQQL